MIALPTSTKIASFDVDCQCCFTPLCPDELPAPGGEHIVAELNAQAQLADLRIGSKDAHAPTAQWVATETHPPFTPLAGENMDTYWPLHAVPGTKGFTLLPELPKVTDYDFFVWKGIEPDMHPYGACFHDFAERLSTGVIEFLTHHSVKTVLVGGLALDYCVKHTVLQLLRHHFHVIVNLAACRGIAPQSVAQAKEEMVKAGAIFVSSASEITRAS